MTQNIDAEVQALTIQTDKPNLTALSYALRHPETWPSDFVWDYGNCDRCAVGLAARLWRFAIPDEHKAQATLVAREMAMPYREADRIFFRMGTVCTKWTRRGWARVHDFRTVGPDDVADAIDRYLAVSLS